MLSGVHGMACRVPGGCRVRWAGAGTFGASLNKGLSADAGD